MRRSPASTNNGRDADLDPPGRRGATHIGSPPIYRLTFAVLLIAVAGVSTWAIARHRTQLDASGLRARYSPRDGKLAPWSGREHSPSAAVVRRAARTADGPFHAEWSGYLVVPDDGAYRFAIAADDRAALWIANQPPIRATDAVPHRTVTLRRGPVAIRIEYEDDGGYQASRCGGTPVAARSGRCRQSCSFPRCRSSQPYRCVGQWRVRCPGYCCSGGHCS